MPRARILLGDDHALILEGLRSVLSKDFEVVAIASNGRDVVTETERLKPDVVLLDVSMPVLNGMEAARQIKKSMPQVKLLFVTQNPIGSSYKPLSGWEHPDTSSNNPLWPKWVRH